MTRNEKIALGIGAGVVVFGGLALYFSATSKPPSSASPVATPPQIPPQPQFSPTTSPTPPKSISPTTTPASQFPPSWNQFTNIIAGHTYVITLTSAIPLDWASIVKPNAIPGGFNGPFGHATPTPTQYTYSLAATVSHQVQNVGFLLGVEKYVDVSVTDLGVL